MFSAEERDGAWAIVANGTIVKWKENREDAEAQAERLNHVSVTCPTCGGDGEEWPENADGRASRVTCSECGGRGRVDEVACPHCAGTGDAAISDEEYVDCPRCAGSGVVTRRVA